MGLPAGCLGDAWRRDGARGADDPVQPPPAGRQRRDQPAGGLIARLLGLAAGLFLTSADAAEAQSLRILLWNTGLSRSGPGLFLSDIRQRDDDVLRAAAVISALAPDVAVLLDIDHDLNAVALRAFAGTLADAGLDLPHYLAPRPNTGVFLGLDLDRDGRSNEAEDALGWGRFAGEGGIAILSRWPIALVQDHGARAWRDASGAALPRDTAGASYFSEAELDVLPLFSVGAFEASVTTPGDIPLRLMTWHASPPVFDGPERRNRLRNAAENTFWTQRLAPGSPDDHFVLLGDANLDPVRGDGAHEVIRTLLASPALQDPQPSAVIPALGRTDTATGWWPDGPGALRVDYLLPDARLSVLASGLEWPDASTHAVLWADLAWPP